MIIHREPQNPIHPPYDPDLSPLETLESNSELL